MLLKVFSQMLDEDIKYNKPMPRAILDAGSGVGVLGICAAGAVSEIGGIESLSVRAQDRDDLARIFTQYNAEKNNIPERIFTAHTEPLLAGVPDTRFDLILSNVPAKAGLPVLKDFVIRSTGRLNAGGRVIIVAVNTLHDFFELLIQENAVPLYRETGTGHTVFVYGKDNEREALSCLTSDSFFIQCPTYIRNKNDYEMENISYHMETIHGASGFDNPCGEAEAAAKLTIKLKDKLTHNHDAQPVLIWSEDQGHYAAWLLKYLNVKTRFVLAGRNILSQSIAKYNISEALGEDRENTESVIMINAADILLDREKIITDTEAAFPFTNDKPHGFRFIAFFPEQVPGTENGANNAKASWEGLTQLTYKSSVVIAGFTSSEAERFDKKKPQAFVRLGDIKRNGFRALAYRRK